MARDADRRTAAALRPRPTGVLAILLWAALALITVRARGHAALRAPGAELRGRLRLGVVVAGLARPDGLAQLRQPAAPWLTAFCGIFLYHALYFFALSAAPAGRRPASSPISGRCSSCCFSAALPGEAAAGAASRGARCSGSAGTALILTGRSGRAARDLHVAGYAAAFGCALVWSGYSVLNRRFAAVPSGMIVGVCGAVALAGPSVTYARDRACA